MRSHSVLRNKASPLTIDTPTNSHTSHRPRNRVSSAAAIAGLLGGHDANKVQSIAMSKFRAVSLADVSLDDMMQNKPDARLLAKTVPATFHSVDAFVSHSWYGGGGSHPVLCKPKKSDYKNCKF